MAVAYASGTVSGAANPANLDTVTIGGKVYTFQTALTNVDGNVLIGANITATLQNLANAIILGPGAGTTYATAMTVNPHVTCAVPSASPLTVWSKVPGAIGNLIALAKSSVNLAVSGATLASGSGSLYDDIKAYIAREGQLHGGTWQQLIDWSDPLNLG